MNERIALCREEEKEWEAAVVKKKKTAEVVRVVWCGVTGKIRRLAKQDMEMRWRSSERVRNESARDSKNPIARSKQHGESDSESRFGRSESASIGRT